MNMNFDVAIFGGGIAGLWTLARLRQQGFNAILFETDALGAGQTIKSQGIIHGGLKYALSGQVNSSVTSLQDMPSLWQNCLKGTGEVDLGQARILAPAQHMWSIDRLTGGIATLFASNSMRSHVDEVEKGSWPAAIANSAIKSKLYKLSELVLDIPSVLHAIAKPYLEHCIKIAAHDEYKLHIVDNQIKAVVCKIAGTTIEVKAQKYIFTAGSGNQHLTDGLSQKPNMQLRPLHMVLVKAKNLLPLYGHCIGLNTVPRITVTTHTAADHMPVWYLGGKLAEEGVQRSAALQIAETKAELAALFPNLDLTNAKFATFFVDRAEAKQSDGSKPNTATIFSAHNYITAWPTKLALAPVLTQQIMQVLQTENIRPQFNDHVPANFPQPLIATAIWDQLL